jgi:5-hydroxyisourate hydrolase
MSGLTTHILDLTSGRPADAVAVRVSRLESPGAAVATAVTDADGRARLAEADTLAAGGYRIAFEIGAYFRRTGAAVADPGFLECVAIEFQVTDPAAHHHVPLLVSPFGYSTYRGS